MSGYAVGYDAIRTNISSLPRGAQVYAGYSTGSGDVPWSGPDFQAHATALGPCLWIDQDPAASDATADYLDVERGAAAIADCPGWAKRARADFEAARRPGQRSPAIYQSASNVTPVVNSLIAGGVTSGVGLIIANWSITETHAIADVLGAAGPFPVVGVQFADDGPFDVNIFSRAWLAGMAGRWEVPKPVPAPPARQPTVPQVIEWTTAGMGTLHDLASKHRTEVGTILRLTAQHSPGGVFPGEVANYINAVFAGQADPRKAAPKGLRLWLPGS